MALHPFLSMLIVAALAIGGRFAADAYNDSKAIEKTTCYGESCYTDKTPGPGSIPSSIAIGIPYIVAAIVGYFLLTLAPLLIFLGTALAAFLWLGFHNFGGL